MRGDLGTSVTPPLQRYKLRPKLSQEGRGSSEKVRTCAHGKEGGGTTVYVRACRHVCVIASTHLYCLA